jgi:taurine dioxygenase
MNIRNAATPLDAEFTDVDLAKSPDESAFRVIRDVLHDRGVIVFRNQLLTEEQHIAFSRRFGELEIHVAKQYLKPGHPKILGLSNIIENGRNIGATDPGEYSHSDLSYVANPSPYSLSYAIEVPIADAWVLGATLFASAAYAYESLPDDLKARLESMRAIHRYADRYKKQQQAGGRGAPSEERLGKVPDVLHPMIRMHPVTGRDVLFVNEGFTVSIDGMPKNESDLLLRELFTHIVRPEVVYKHEWQQGDLLMWDNGLVQHRAIRDYDLPLRRLMHRTTVAGHPTLP